MNTWHQASVRNVGFEGVSLVGFRPPVGPPEQDIAGLEPLHEQVLALLGPAYEKLHKRE